MTNEQTLRLSRIYRSIVNDIEDILGVAIIGADEAKIIEVLDDAVGKAVNVMSKCNCQIYEDCEKCR